MLLGEGAGAGLLGKELRDRVLREGDWHLGLLEEGSPGEI